MRTRILGAILAALSFVPLAARADDTKPPVISDVKASAKGGKVFIEAKITDDTGVLSATCFHRKVGGAKFDDTAMIKDDFSDSFKISFSGGGDTEYYIQSTDLLGNGPSAYGSASKPMALGGGAAVAANEPAPKPPKEPREPKPPREHVSKPPAVAVAKKPEPKEDTPPVIKHHKPTAQPTDGQDFKVRVQITASNGLKKQAMFVRPQGWTGERIYKEMVPLVGTGQGDGFEATIPADMAHGNVEYVLMAEDNDNKRTTLGDPYPTWFAITFKGAQALVPVLISTNSPAKVPPGKTIHIRAQATLPALPSEMTDAEAADFDAKIGAVTAKLITRTQDVGEQMQNMVADPSGGSGGFMADIPGQPEGSPVYYQVLVCVSDKCAIDTGHTHKWNSFTATKGPAIVPAPVTGSSSKLPPGLPD